MKLELKKIRQQRLEWIDAVNSNDLSRIGEILSASVVWIPSSMPALNGREAILEWMKPSFDGFDHQYRIDNIRIKGAGNWAFEQADFTSTLTPKEGGGPVENTGSYILIWRWEDDNVWRIERYVDNSEVLELA